MIITFKEYDRIVKRIEEMPEPEYEITEDDFDYILECLHDEETGLQFLSYLVYVMEKGKVSKELNSFLRKQLKMV